MRRNPTFTLAGPAAAGPDPLVPLKAVIWLYFWLLIFEGALRKWVLPQFSDLLFVARDPVAIIAYVLALRAGVFPFRPAVVVVAVLAVASLACSVAGSATFMVVLFGLRTDFLHLPLVFVMANVMDRDDVKRFGLWTMILAVPIGLLMTAQFSASPSSWLNVPVGGGEGSQLRGAMGKIRPPGPFSFITGAVSYYSLVAAFVCHEWLERRAGVRLALWLATITTIAVVPISISRSMLLGVLIVMVFAVPVLLGNLRAVPRVLGPLVVMLAYLTLALDTVYVQAFVTRWDEAAVAGRGGFYENVLERFFETFTQPILVAADAPLFGHGIGMGTLAGGRLMTGSYTFLLAESELSRLVLELGPIVGLAFIVWRVWLAGAMLRGGWRELQGRGNSLPWLLAGAGFFNVILGQWGQATQLGFAVFGAGLTLAAMNLPAGSESPDASTTPARPRPAWGR